MLSQGNQNTVETNMRSVKGDFKHIFSKVYFHFLNLCL
jgi:hypothetical protein